MELLERFVPLLVAVLTAVTPIVLAIHSSGRKDRAQGKENSEKLCGAVESLKDSIDRMDTRIEILETHAREDHRRLLVMEILEEKLPIEKNMWPLGGTDRSRQSTRCCWRSTGASRRNNTQ